MEQCQERYIYTLYTASFRSVSSLKLKYIKTEPAEKSYLS